MAQEGLTITLDEADYKYVMGQLTKLSELEKSAVVQRGLQEGIAVIVNQGKRNLRARLSNDPVNIRARKGNLYKSIGRKTIKKKLKGYGGFKRPGGNAAHLVDRGTEKRWTKKGAYRGSVSKGSPNTGSRFWTDAFLAKKNEAAMELMESVRKSIQKLAK